MWKTTASKVEDCSPFHSPVVPTCSVPFLPASREGSGRALHLDEIALFVSAREVRGGGWEMGSVLQDMHDTAEIWGRRVRRIIPYRG